MTSPAELLKTIAGLSGQTNYVAWSIADIAVFYGAPPVKIRGLDYVIARHNFPQKRLVMGLTGSGVFVTNQNTSGIIEIGVLNASASCVGLAAMELLGIPFPIAVMDKQTNGLGYATATACQQVATPEWRRELTPGIAVFTFETPRLLLSHGMKKLAS